MQQGVDQLHQPAHRIVGELRIGGVALAAIDGDRAGQRAAPADLDHVAERVRDWSARRRSQASHLSPLAAAHSSSLTVPLIAGPSSSPVISSDTEPFGPPCFVDMARHRGDEAGNAALHVDGAAAIHLAVGDLGGEGRMRPGGFVAGRHHVGVAGEHQMRAVAGAPRIEVLDVRRAVFRKHRPLDGKAERLQHLLQRAQRTAFGGRHGGAADEGGEVFGGVGRQRHGREAIIESARPVTPRRHRVKALQRCRRH